MMKKLMKSLDPQIDPIVQRKLMSLQAAPARNPHAAASGRARFMAQAETLGPAVSKSETVRHSGMKAFFSTLFNRKEHAPMFAPIVSILLVASLLVGGAGATVVAAQTSLPDQPLYGLKIMTEDTRLELSSSDQSKLAISLQFANRRVEETRLMLEKGTPLQEAVLTRLQNQLDQAFHLAAGLNEDQVGPALEQIRQELQIQEKAMEQLQTKAGPQAEPVLTQARQLIQTRLGWADAGLSDPRTFRQQFRQQGPGKYGIPPTSRPESAPSGFGPGPSPTGAPANSYGPGPEAKSTAQPETGKQYGPGPYITGTPTPGSGYGPGPGPDATCTPQGGSYGPGPGGNGDQGTGNGYGPGPNPTSTQVPEDTGSSPTQPPASGNGPGPNATQTPGGGYGPGPGPQPSSTCTPQAGSGGPQGPGGGGNRP